MMKVLGVAFALVALTSSFKILTINAKLLTKTDGVKTLISICALVVGAALTTCSAVLMSTPRAQPPLPNATRRSPWWKWQRTRSTSAALMRPPALLDDVLKLALDDTASF